MTIFEKYQFFIGQQLCIPECRTYPVGKKQRRQFRSSLSSGWKKNILYVLSAPFGLFIHNCVQRVSSDKREKYYPIQNTYLYTIHVSLKIAVVKCSSAVSLYDIVYSCQPWKISNFCYKKVERRAGRRKLVFAVSQNFKRFFSFSRNCNERMLLIFSILRNVC